MVVSFVKGEGDDCDAAPTGDWDEIEASELSASFKHETRLTEEQEVCFAVKVVIGEETTFCDLKVSEDSDGFVDGYQPENALKITLGDVCGGCASELRCDGKDIKLQAQICTDSGETAACAPDGAPSFVDTCGDLAYCIEAGELVDCASCNCTAGITCDGNVLTQGVKTFARCDEHGECVTEEISCADIVTCTEDPAGIRTQHGQCSATAENGCVYDEGTVENCGEPTGTASCEDGISKKPVAACIGETPICGSKIVTENCTEAGKECLRGVCVLCQKPEHCTEDAEFSCDNEDLTPVCSKTSGSACVGGYFGSDCSKLCLNAHAEIHCADQKSAVCNQETGNTESCNACPAGYYGSDCNGLCTSATDTNVAVSQCAFSGPGDVSCIQTGTKIEITSCAACATGYYGINCSFTCPNNDQILHCKDGASTNCDQITGQTATCAACADGFWNGDGADCSASCANGADQHCKTPEAIACDRTTGVITNCSKGCELGFTGADCKSQCENDDGQHCAKPAKSQCDQVSGAITECSDDGCAQGWFGADCKSRCENGEEQHCQNPEDAVCARADGRISECSEAGCEQGWYDFDCKSQCKNAEGQHCAHPEQSACDQTTGEIAACSADGCKDGWYGTDCRSICIDLLDDSKHCITKDENGYTDYSKVTCDGTNITCKACEDGYWGDDCSKRCMHNNRCDENGRITCDKDWGINVTCSACVLGGGQGCQDICKNGTGENETHCVNPSSAICKEGVITDCGRPGCKDGYYGPACNTECAVGAGNHCAHDSTITCTDDIIVCNKCFPGYYGSDCSKTCRNALDPNQQHCAANALVTCDTDGENASNLKCSVCDPGFGGVDCQKPCENSDQTHCATPGTARCKEVSDDDSNAITACDVEDSCEGNHWFGPSCATSCSETAQPHHCSALNETSQCDRTGGISDCGSADGQRIACEDGYYGDACNKACNEISGIANQFHCKSWANVTCDKNGSAIESCGDVGCQDGWYGDACNKPCVAAIDAHLVTSFCDTGADNSVSCVETLVDGVPTIEITSCTACQDGWYGNTCTQSCKEALISEGLRAHNHCDLSENELVACVENTVPYPPAKITSCSACVPGYWDDETYGPCVEDCDNLLEAIDEHPATNCAYPDASQCGQKDGFITACSTDDEGRPLCDLGFYGTLCEIPCAAPTEDQHCPDIIELDVNGEAFAVRNYVCSGAGSEGWRCTQCAVGYFGETCSEPCANGSGQHCAHPERSECEQDSGELYICSEEGCETGWWGDGCKRACANGSGQHCAHPELSTCDRSSGGIDVCTGGCEDGWYGPRCTLACSSQMANCGKCTGTSPSNFQCIACSANHWGSDCSGTCCEVSIPSGASPQEQNELNSRMKSCKESSARLGEECQANTDYLPVCDRATGLYVDGVSCTACPSGFWDGLQSSDRDCQERCTDEAGNTHCLNGGICDKETGVITECFGNSGNLCQQGYYGADCTLECRYAPEAEHCAKDNPQEVLCRQEGSLLKLVECRSCEPGWFGPRCDQQCPNSTEGKHCASIGHAVCDQNGVTLSCTACDEHYWGPACEHACNEGLTSELNHCGGLEVQDVTCNQDGSGQKCTACDEHYWGPACDRACSEGLSPETLHCLDEVTCDRNGKNKSCSACDEHYWGTLCNHACSDGLRPDVNFCVESNYGDAEIDADAVTCNRNGSGKKCSQRCRTGNPDRGKEPYFFTGDLCDREFVASDIPHCGVMTAIHWQMLSLPEDSQCEGVGGDLRCSLCAANYYGTADRCACLPCERIEHCDVMLCEESFKKEYSNSTYKMTYALTRECRRCFPPYELSSDKKSCVLPQSGD